MSGRTLLVIAKEPLPGMVKTRLAADVGAQAAADLAAACLADTLDAVAAAPAERRVLVLDGRPGPWLPAGIEVVPQVGGGLAKRLAAAFAAAEGPAFLVGMDTPQLTPELLDVDLCSTDAVLGMAQDGGFWGIGMRHPRAEVFAGVPMSTPETGAAQRLRLTEAGFTVAGLPVLTDVDTLADARSVARLCPGTRFAAAFARIEGEPFATVGQRGMLPPALHLYDDAVRTGRALRLVASGGQLLPFALDRWSLPADVVDQTMLDRCTGATLDVGCGPGRLTAALAQRGQPVLGVDIASAAVERTTSLGALALCRSVFDQLPGEGRWDTVLLADGNLGIGGDPSGLLARVRELLRPGGRLVVEPEPFDVDEVVELELHTADGAFASAPFRWARVGPAATIRRARAAGFELDESWTSGGRRFFSLRT